MKHTKLKIIRSVAEMRNIRKNLQGSVGFVPTMGALHKGHISLIKPAQHANDNVIVSIFVNQKQFTNTDDYRRYPHTQEQDIQLLENIDTDIAFLPTAEELYPQGYQTYVTIEKITDLLEGKSRPGHFQGVTTIVTKLFNIIQPDTAYFGQKDAQQVAVIKKMVTDLNMLINIAVGSTVREKDGLAMSSRNVFLNDQERKEATVIYQSLLLAKELFRKEEHNPEKIKKAMEHLIDTTSGKIDYISIADTQTLEELEVIQEDGLVSLAVYFSKTRLIDNICLKN